MKVKLIIADVVTTATYNPDDYDDYSEVSKIFADEYSQWEEVDVYTQLGDLRGFVCDFNTQARQTKSHKFAFIVEESTQIPIKSALAEMVEKRRKELEAAKAAREEYEKREADKKKAKAMKKAAKTEAERKKLLEELKKEFGEA
jgi:hypothetical protein